MNHPKILVVSESPKGSLNGFGITLKTFFENWPDQKFKQLYTDGKFVEEFGNDDEQTFAHVPLSPGRRFLIPYLLGIKPEWRGSYSKRWLTKTLKDYKADLIYIFIYSETALRFGHWIANQLNIPYIVHIGDDLFHGKASCEIKKILKEARFCLSICSTMSNHYQKLFGISFQHFHNAADKMFLDKIREARNSNETLIRFVGGYYKNLHEEAVDDLVKVVEELNSEGYLIKFEFWGYDVPKNCFSKFISNNVEYKGGFSHEEESVQLLQSSDILIIPASFNATSRKHYQYSIPTKLTECLASGTPVLVYAPDNMGSVDFCKNNGLAQVITNRSMKQLKEMLITLINNRQEFELQAERDREFIRNNYSAEIVRTKFQNVLFSAVA